MASIVDLRTVTAEDFEPRLNSTFTVDIPDRQLALKLHQVTRLGRAMREGGAFSLLFVTEPGPFLPQATYPLTHPDMGETHIFLVPLGPRPAGNTYEAVFT